MFLKVSGTGKKQANNWVLKDIGFTQQRFQKIAVAGETGSGKSTLLKIIAGLEHPDAGIVTFEDKKVISPLDTLIPGQPGIAYLSQHFELRNNYRVEELLEYANKLSDQEANTIFEVCRIDHLLKRKVDQVSGGEKQRVALARLLVGSPRLLLLDEPFSNMDPIHKNILKTVLHDIAEQLQITCILTSHDPMDTLSWADEILVMKGGRIIQKDAPEILYNRPVNEYAAGLFGKYNLLSAADARAFPALQNTTDPGKKIFIRPEHFIVNNGDAEEVPAIIRKKSYWGSYLELEVLAGDTVITVRPTDMQLAEGDSIGLFISKQTAIHYLL